MTFKSLKIYLRYHLFKKINTFISNTFLFNFYKKILFNVFYPIYQKGLVIYLRRKNKVNVVFVASSLSMWRYQNIYKLLNEHSRFKVSIVILPFISYSEDQQKHEINTLKSYFDSLGIQYFVGDSTSKNILKKLSPNVLFYPQPYGGLYEYKYDFYSFKNRLLCYYPYAFWIATDDWSYNMPLHNYAWKLFYSTALHRKDAQIFAINKGKNVEVVGYPNADNFLYKKCINVWKPQIKSKKRIIWAPHYTIIDDGYLTQSNFLWMAEFMLDLSNRYLDKIQFAFKPHPRLLTELYKQKDWGKDKALHYYKEWETRENTQLEQGEFIDLFMTSDAMIHDSGSFSDEYHYTGNPVMYVADNFEQLLSERSEFGELAMRQHYVGKCKDDIINFIDNVVLNGDDPMKKSRKDFYNKYLLPPNGKSVAENTMDVFLKAFC